MAGQLSQEATVALAGGSPVAQVSGQAVVGLFAGLPPLAEVSQMAVVFLYLPNTFGPAARSSTTEFQVYPRRAAVTRT